MIRQSLCKHNVISTGFIWMCWHRKRRIWFTINHSFSTELAEKCLPAVWFIYHGNLNFTYANPSCSELSSLRQEFCGTEIRKTMWQRAEFLEKLVCTKKGFFCLVWLLGFFWFFFFQWSRSEKQAKTAVAERPVSGAADLCQGKGNC